MQSKTVSVTLYGNSKKLHAIFARYQLQAYRFDTEKDLIESLYLLSQTLSSCDVTLSNPRDNTYLIQI